jgi:hypothetical protein
VTTLGSVICVSDCFLAGILLRLSTAASLQVVGIRVNDEFSQSGTGQDERWW